MKTVKKIGAIIAVAMFIMMFVPFNQLATRIAGRPSLQDRRLGMNADPLNSDQTGDNWPMFHAALNHTGTVETTPVSGSSVAWSYNMGIDISEVSPAIVNGVVYAGSYSHKVFAFNETTGALKWSYTTGNVVDLSSPAISSGRLFIGSTDSKVYSLNATTGSLIWSYTTGGAVYSSPAVFNDSVYVGSSDSKVYALNATTGSLIWSYTTGNGVISSPAIANGSIYIGSTDHQIYSLNASTGVKIWNFTTGSDVYSSPAITNDRVFVGSLDHEVYSLNATTGTKLWNFTASNSVYSSPAVDGGRVYIASYDHVMYCLNVTTGALLWSFTTGNQVFSSPAVAGGYVYFGSYDWKVYALNATTGAFVWYYITRSPVNSSPGVANGHVFVTSWDGSIYDLPMILLSAPYVPRNPAAVGDHNHVILSWQIPASNGGFPITGYKIYEGTTPGGEILNATIGNVTRYIASGLGGVVYYFKIAAINSFGTSVNSSEVNAIMITPLGIYSDADWVKYASGGSGTIGSPWIIAGYSLNCDFNGSGIIIQNTRDYAILNNIVVNNSGNGGLDAGIRIFGSNNIVLSNVTVMNSRNVGLAIANCTNIVVNASIVHDSTQVNVYVDGSYDIRFMNSVFANTSGTNVLSASLITLNVSRYITFANDIFACNNTITSTFEATSINFIYVDNCTFKNGSAVILETNANHIFFRYCTFISISGYFIDEYASNSVFDNNTFDNRLGLASRTFNIDFSPTNVTISNNVISSVSTAVYIASGDIKIVGNHFTSILTAVFNVVSSVIVTSNYFTNITTYLVGSPVVTWDGNYYHGYFNVYPFDVTLNSTTNILQHSWNLGNVIDRHPRYNAPWYPRSQVIHLQFDSAVTGTEIPFESLGVTLDGMTLTTDSPTINHVLFHLVVVIPRTTPVYLDKIYNLNSTGLYLREFINVAPQIFVSYFSTLDQFGVVFSDMKLFINNVRTAIFDPTIIPEVSNFVVKDFANRVLFNQTLNISVTTIFVDIGIPYTTMTVHNNFSTGVIFRYAINNVENSFPLVGGQTFPLRIAIGNYTWQVTDKKGNLMKDINGTVLSSSIDITGPQTLDFGFVSIPTPQNAPNLQSSILEIVIVIEVLAVVVFLVVRRQIKRKDAMKRQVQLKPSSNQRTDAQQRYTTKKQLPASRNDKKRRSPSTSTRMPSTTRSRYTQGQRKGLLK